jgi:hypothetical protein
MEVKMSDQTAPQKHPGLTPGAKEDPRDGPFSEEELAEGARGALNTRRWTKEVGADLLAMRLQVGRGRSFASVADQFDVNGNSFRRWRNREGGWSDCLPEADRRDLARRVILAGKARRAVGRVIGEEELRATAEWRMPKKDAAPIWRPTGASSSNMDTNDDAYDAETTDSVEAAELRAQLDALIQRMRRDIAGAEEGAGAEEETGAEDGADAES